MTTDACLALVPRDGFFCKDGRGWHTSSSGRGHALAWPWPSTVLGAVRTAWGREEERREGRPFRPDEWIQRTSALRIGPTLALRRPAEEAWCIAHRVWPVPADALWLEGREKVLRLDPRPPRAQTLGRDDDEAREVLWTPIIADSEKPGPAPLWWSEGELREWLCGLPVSVRPRSEWVRPASRAQVHVGIGPDTSAAADGVLFSHDVIETLELNRGRAGAAGAVAHEWAIAVQGAFPASAAPTLATLGSDRRLARVERLSRDLFEPPLELLEVFRRGCRGLRMVIAAPAVFAAGWLPDGLRRDGRVFTGRLATLSAEVVLRAALVPRPTHVSGWDMAAGEAKPTSRMVPSGATYFFERADGGSFAESDARALWLASLGARTDEGFGRIVPGIWHPERS